MTANGSRIAYYVVGDSNHPSSASILDASSCSSIRKWTFKANLTDVTIFPDGSAIAARFRLADRANRIQVLRTSDGAVSDEFIFGPPYPFVHSLVVSEDGQWLAAAGGSSPSISTLLFRTNPLRLVAAGEGGVSAPQLGLQFQATGKLVFAPGQDHVLSILPLPSEDSSPAQGSSAQRAAGVRLPVAR
jgi:hypothetical protein